MRLRVLGECPHEGQWLEIGPAQPELWVNEIQESQAGSVFDFRTGQAIAVAPSVKRVVYLRHILQYGKDRLEFLAPLGMPPIEALRRQFEK